ncbi:RmlC-like cupin domain-containing protein [Echria macrotheca]|uniref:Mannose-6-phosphate isomerase n=1 Tax=Echria macrotheca TaxID=438768 RepID=A0AAJ0BHP8_9PEZI|nr:RmlC-like cupin domain-containing protein [Echria macrotheca]
MTDRVFRLKGECNHYPWGKKGSQSLAAQLHGKNDKSFSPKEDEYYSELWFGDYPTFPARVFETGELLKDVIHKNPEALLGKKVLTDFGENLPFLPKILSIAKALPLQMHPDKWLAAKLNKQDADTFGDPNHKPEIAVALSKFETFAGFKPLSQIEPLFRLPALRPFVPKDTPDKWLDQTLREVVRTIIKSDGATVKSALETLRSTPKADLGDSGHYILDLLPRLEEQYGPEDPGTIVALTCMNFMVLSPGDAIFIPADGIHAYLSGDIVECMARSDNVVNAGFCPPGERNDADLFADNLTFEAHSGGDVKLAAQESEKSGTGKTVVYKPPMREFNMFRTDLGAGEQDEIQAFDGPGVGIVTAGRGKMVADGKEVEVGEGEIYFFAPGVGVKWEADGEGMQVYMAVA